MECFSCSGIETKTSALQSTTRHISRLWIRSLNQETQPLFWLAQHCRNGGIPCTSMWYSTFFLIRKHTSLRFSARAEDFSRKYIWPNTYLPTPAIILNAINTASQGRFVLDSVENHGFRKYLTLGTQAQPPKFRGRLREDDQRMGQTLFNERHPRGPRQGPSLYDKGPRNIWGVLQEMALSLRLRGCRVSSWVPQFPHVYIHSYRMSPLLPSLQLTFDTGRDFNC